MTRNWLSPFDAGRSGPARETDIQVAFLNSVFLLAGVVAFGMGFVRWASAALSGSPRAFEKGRPT
ncbi:MAG: hypothetical protein Q8Q28_08320 [Pseudomonadota bacterium]|nr:hypothetical protein [Pseudomonadota bacterium]